MPNPESAPHRTEASSEEANQLEAIKRLKTRRIGAKALVSANFESRHKDIVDSSFHKFQQSSEKIPTIEGENPLKNPEKRDYVYLSRLENIIDKYGTKAEKRLWDMSARKLIIDEENIPDSYWKAQEQILRDNGQGRKLSSHEKDLLIQDAQAKQRASLETWSSYLGDENSPYPVWFKIFAWDGMSKLGVFDKNKKQYTKRDKTTMAPFPTINPAALAKTYGVVSNFYGIHNDDCYDEDAAPSDLDQLAQSGNFNKIYSKMLLESKVILKTPEKTEDVKGDWVEYLPGDEKKLSLAAEGTPWCIADPNVGHNYLTKGAYGEDYDEDDYDSSSQAKFILFHLEDPATSQLADSACASIRLDTEGNVAEISGLNDGQAIEDSLIPIVETKVKTLPGGEKFLQAFADKKELIRLDRKWQAGDDFTPEEWDFVFEKNRSIVTLDTYNESDPRLDEFRSIEALKHGADADNVANYMLSGDLANNLDALMNGGADIAHIASRMDSVDIAKNLDKLTSYGADVNIDKLISTMFKNDIARNLDILIKHGADVDELMSKLGGHRIAEKLDVLIDNGVSVDTLMSKMNTVCIFENIDTLNAHGANIDVNDLMSRMKKA